MNRQSSRRFSLFVILSFYLTSVVSSPSRKLTAITDQMPFVGQLYLYLKTESNVSMMLANIEPPETRKLVCQDIMNNDYFKAKGLVPVHMEDFHDNVAGVSEYDIIYHRTSETDLHPRYVNPYQRLIIRFAAIVDTHALNYTVISRYEDLFLCLTKTRDFGEIRTYWISKEYNVATQLSTHPKNARFVFRESGEFVAMAEEPATALASPDVNIELEYIRRKRIFKSAASSVTDPLCTLVEEGGLKNEYDRLCMTALGSSYFEGRFRLHPRKLNVDQCFRNRVSFQTEQSRAEAVGLAPDVRSEWMIRCMAREIDTGRVSVYMISRAYQMQTVFVYSLDFSNGRTYLENLSTDVEIVDFLVPKVDQRELS